VIFAEKPVAALVLTYFGQGTYRHGCN